MMSRLQIQLTDQQRRQMRCVAHRDEISLAELVRRAVDDYLAADEKYAKERHASALLFVGCGDSQDMDDPEGADCWVEEW